MMTMLLQRSDWQHLAFTAVLLERIRHSVILLHLRKLMTRRNREIKTDLMRMHIMILSITNKHLLLMQRKTIQRLQSGSVPASVNLVSLRVFINSLNTFLFWIIIGNEMWILEVNNILGSCKSLLSVKLTGRLTHRERSWIWPLYRHLFQSHRSLEFVCSAFPPEEHSGCISVQILQHKEHALSSNQHRAFIRECWACLVKSSQVKSSWALLSFHYMCGHIVGRDVVPHRTTVLHKYKYTTRSKTV